MTDIKVSVIVPIYNVEKYLRQCLQSIADQSLKEIEIICVDDGSTDSSPQIVNEFAEKDSRFISVSQENGGAGKARNTGLRMAKGKYLSFLDSDDFFDKNMLLEAYNTAEQYDADFSVFRSDQYYENENEFKQVSWTVRYPELPPYQPFNRHAMTDNVFKVFVGWAWDKLYNREFVISNNLWFQEQRTSNDMLFVFTATAIAKKIAYVSSDKVLAHQRRDSSDSLSKTREKSWDCFYKALTALKERLISEGLFNELEKDFINYALHFSLWNLNTLAQPTYDKLYNKLKTEWWQELGVAGKDESYFYSRNKKEYAQFAKIMGE